MEIRSRERRVWNGQSGAEKHTLWGGDSEIDWCIGTSRDLGLVLSHSISVPRYHNGIWLGDDESGIQKQEVYNNLTFTIKNAFVKGVLCYTISILNIKFLCDITFIWHHLLPLKKISLATCVWYCLLILNRVFILSSCFCLLSYLYHGMIAHWWWLYLWLKFLQTLSFQE